MFNRKNINYNNVMTLAFGIGWSIILGIIIGYIKVLTGFSLYAVTLNKIIPFGSIITGFILFCGYYLTANLLHNELHLKESLISLIIMSIITFFVIHYVPYCMLESNGVKIKQVISFWEYFDMTVRNTLFTFRINNHPPYYKLGAFWGYVLALLKIAGYLFGSIYIFIMQYNYKKNIKSGRVHIIQ